jgi:hypothetical protein
MHAIHGDFTGVLKGGGVILTARGHASRVKQGNCNENNPNSHDVCIIANIEFADKGLYQTGPLSNSVQINTLRQHIDG